MRIVFDVSQTTGNKTGIENYFYQLTQAFLELETDNEIILLSNNEEYLNEFPDKYEKKVIKSKIPNFIWMLRVALWLRLKKADIFVSQSNFMFSLLFPKTIQIVYDIGPFEYPEFYEKSFVKKFRRHFKVLVKKSKYMACISETTRENVEDRFPEAKDKLWTIGSGLAEWVKLGTSDKKELFKRIGIENKYVLSVGTLQPRKNYLNMIRGFAKFSKKNPDASYVIVGKKGWMYNEILTEAQNLGIEDKVIFAGYVDNEDLVTLYTNADAFINCSYFEGFGLPLVEAYNFGLPIVASDIQIFREVLDEGAMYVDPDDTDKIGNALNKVFGKKSKIDKEFLERYEWENVAKALNYELQVMKGR